MKTIFNIAMIAILVGLCSCEKEIFYDDIAPEPLLVVNGLQRVGEPAHLCVEKSSFYTTGETDFRVKDVHADLYVNGVFKETLRVRDSIIMESYYIWHEEDETEELSERMRCAFNYCEGEYIICEGDELRFEVSSSEFDKVAVAQTTMPEIPNVLSFDTLWTEHNGDAVNVYFALKIDDPVGTDYYNLYPRYGLEGFFSTDPVFSDFMNVVHVDDMFGESDYYGNGPYNLFSDSYFDGKQYSVTLNINYYFPGESYSEPFVLEVSRVDHAFYQYKKSLELYEATTNIEMLSWFAEPTQVYSNVENGVGLVGAQSSAVVKIIDITENNTR